MKRKKNPTIDIYNNSNESPGNYAEYEINK